MQSNTQNKMPVQENPDTFKYTCPTRCQNPQHATNILHAIRSMAAAPIHPLSPTSTSDAFNDTVDKEQLLLAAYIMKTCRNFARIHNAQNRSTALHVIAQVPYIQRNLLNLAECLLNHGADVNATESTTGRTALHYACLHQNLALATLLCRRGGDLNALDARNMQPMSYLAGNSRSDRRALEFGSVPMEVWVWGNMNNDNCGFVRYNTDRDDDPMPLDSLNRNGIYVCQVAMSPLHTLFADVEGRIFVVGNGSSGLLGMATTQSTILEPMELNLGLKNHDVIHAVSVSRNTSMLLSKKRHVYTCGLNTYHQLGYDTDKQITFRRVRFNLKRPFAPDHIVAQDKYTLALDRDRMVMWGTCDGQFGSKVRSLQPNVIAHIDFVTRVQRVTANDWAIAVQIADESILLMHNYCNQTIALPKLTYIAEFSLETGTARSDPVRMAVLTTEGAILVWTSDIGLMPVSPPSGHFSCNHLLFTNRILTFILDGHVYRSELNVQKMPPKNISTGDDDDFIFPAGYQPFVPGYCCELRYDSRVPFLDNVYCVSGGSDGRSFAALQALSSDHTFDHTSYASGVKVKMPRLRPLFDEAQANDGIVDVIFRVGGRSFPAHQFVVLSRASGLQKFINLRTRLQQPMEVCLDDVPGLTAIMFETVLGQVYDGNRSLDEEWKKVANGSSTPQERTQMDKDFWKFCIDCGLKSSRNSQNDERYCIPFQRLDHPELCDVTLRCGDQRTEVRAHKCILVANSEYFRMMFSRNWSEADFVDLTHVNIEYMSLLLDYLYTDDMAPLLDGQYTDANLFDLIVVCDHMLLQQAVDCFEELLLRRLTAKKCMDMLQFAIDVHLTNMKSKCIQFIFKNAGRMLERRLLDNVSDAVFRQVATYLSHQHREQHLQRFANMQPIVDSALLTMPEMLQFVGNFTVDLSVLPDAPKPPPATVMAPRRNDKITGRSPVAKLPTSLFSGEDLTVSSPKISIPETPEIVRDAKRIADELSAEFARWSKVGSGRQTTTTGSAISKAGRTPPPANANEILANESKLDNVFVKLRRATINQDDEADDDANDTTDEYINEDGITGRRRTVSLGMFTPTVKGKRRSQRVVREEAIAAAAAAIQGTGAFAVVTPDTSSIVENVWASRMYSPPTSAANVTPNRQSTSFFAACQSPSSLQSPFSSSTQDSPKEKKTTDNSRWALRKIQKEEQRDKDNFNRMRNKALWMTQAEEAAIIELQRFYNVDNVFDERIVVDRVPANPTSRSHVVWYQHETRHEDRLNC